MPNPLTKRLVFWKDIYYGWTRKGMAAFITFATIVLSLRDLFVSPQHKDFSFFRYVPQWPWYGWAFIGLVGLILLTLEGSYSKYQRDQVKFRTAYRKKSKAVKAQHQAAILAARVQELTDVQAIKEGRLLQQTGEAEPPIPSLGEQSLPASIDASGRIILNVTAEYLVGLYGDYTNLQADKLTETYVGKWLPFSGELLNASSFADSSIRAYLKGGAFPKNYIVAAEFVDQRWVDHIATFRKGTQVKLIGKIARVESDTIVLEECDLLN